MISMIAKGTPPHRRFFFLPNPEPDVHGAPARVNRISHRVNLFPKENDDKGKRIRRLMRVGRFQGITSDPCGNWCC